MRRLAYALLLIPSFSSATDNVINTTTQDPVVLCSAVRNKLPDNLASIRKLGTMHSEKKTSGADYCEEHENSCSVHHLEFTGLKLSVLEDRKLSEIAPLSIDVAEAKWRLFGEIFVGQPIEVVEKHFKVNIPRDVSPIIVNGECTPLTIWHENGKLVRIELDCQACI